MTATLRPTPDPLGMAEPLRPEIEAALRRDEEQRLAAALDRINPDRLPRLLGGRWPAASAAPAPAASPTWRPFTPRR